METFNRRKIINDPVFGFIKIPFDIVFDLIEHPLFQRMRRIKQLGTTSFVYPGANHTRFQHALGAMHLMGNAIDTIRGKGHEISHEEAEAVTIAILLHDIGHGPFSHTLEKTIIQDVNHERISLMMMELLNREFSGKLTLAIKIFRDEYPKRFLHQLVSGQLDMDRLDYLRRDSFFTGVTEGTIGSDRIIKMLEVVDDRLVIEEKGIYSIEKFLVARRLMYWQVYLHKGVLAGDQLLIKMLQRARDLMASGKQLNAAPALEYFLGEEGREMNGNDTDNFILRFAELDDTDIISSAKIWSRNADVILRYLSKGFLDRRLFRIEISEEPFSKERIEEEKKKVSVKMSVSEPLTDYLVVTDTISNHAYSTIDDNINILGKDGVVKDIYEVSGILNVSVLSKKIDKYYLCFPKKI
ncbi:MAG: HD domain-containing protein [Bacteroidales bacterium]|nr:HD domain-containing protein [Bacteroidales bacterium]